MRYLLIWIFIDQTFIFWHLYTICIVLSLTRYIHNSSIEHQKHCSYLRVHSLPRLFSNGIHSHLQWNLVSNSKCHRALLCSTQEHHLQRAICTGLIIPTPEVVDLADADAYNKIYPLDYKLPRQLIHMQRKFNVLKLNVVALLSMLKVTVCFLSFSICNGTRHPRLWYGFGGWEMGSFTGQEDGPFAIKGIVLCLKIIVFG